jgi:hypothetical protein
MKLQFSLATLLVCMTGLAPVSGVAVQLDVHEVKVENSSSGRNCLAGGGFCIIESFGAVPVIHTVHPLDRSWWTAGLFSLGSIRHRD